LAQHRPSRSLVGTSANVRSRWIDPSGSNVGSLSATEVTDIIPFNEFGDLLDDLDFRDSTAFDADAQVLSAPELDDLNDTDDLTPLRLVVPSEFRADARAEQTDDVSDVPAQRGLHRKATTTTGAVKGRLMIAAMAAGAAAAAAHSAAHAADTRTDPTVLAADESALASGKHGGGVELVTATPAASSAVHREEFANGVAFAQARADREARLQQPLYVMPTRGIPTSGFGYRWGVLHGGIDIANSIGTPILAVSDGVVIDAGPAAGFGMWVKVRHADGTVTLYGHVNTITCRVGNRVMAGDQIATMGNRGNSTGPHLHFEVLLNGTDRVDPVPWLAKRGISVGGFSG
jgi:murein DD-endopeptidase MepM/ murein hydrolase activator NlpD